MPGAPPKIEPQSLGDYLEVMSKAVFQTGMNWAVVDKKWPEIKEAFQEFQPMAVASFTSADLEALANDRRVIRNRRKLEAVVENAREMLELEEEHGSPGGPSGEGFRAYLRSRGGFEPTAADLRKRFRFLGELGAYYFLWVVGEDVPSYEEWCASRGVTPMHG